MSWSIPVKRLYETTTLIAFYHPTPSHPVHILIVPKRRYSSLEDVPVEDTNVMTELFLTVQSLVADLSLSEHGYRLICNGGAY